MVNPFLSSANYDTTTAILYEKSIVHDIGNSVAYTDGQTIYVNTEDNLYKLLPNYDDNMLKWILWHEKMHIELNHHSRYHAYKESNTDSKVTPNEVNIIMDILVHDKLSEMFPTIAPQAEENALQFRDKNSLFYTFKTHTLEKMLKEYEKHKEEEEEETEEETEKKEPPFTTDNTEETEETGKTGETKKETETMEDSKETETMEESKEPSTPTENIAPVDEETQPAKGRHQETDWSELEERDVKEFITYEEGKDIKKAIDTLKNTKIKLAQLTKTLNSLITTTKKRSYKTPSSIMTGQHTIFKGQQRAKASLCLCFDASGSMGVQLQLFKDIITQAIPQALNTPTRWFSGYGAEIPYDKSQKDGTYFKGTFKDILPVEADRGYSDDGDRTIKMCYEMEQEGYSPIGVTDGGGQISWSKDQLKALKRTILIGQCESWLKQAQTINPNIQIIVL